MQPKNGNGGTGAVSAQPGSAGALLEEVAKIARASGAFGAVEVRPGLVVCASTQRDDADYRVIVEGDAVYVAWVTPDRYLSQSIEAELMWTGDDIEELIAEELGDQAYHGPALGSVEHFRDPGKLFTFRSRVPADAGGVSATAVVACLRAYEAAMRELGDMRRGPGVGGPA